jgi:hypothetical protein
MKMKNEILFLPEFLCQFCPHAFYTEERHINHVNSHHKAGNKPNLTNLT